MNQLFVCLIHGLAGRQRWQLPDGGLLPRQDEQPLVLAVLHAWLTWHGAEYRAAGHEAWRGDVLWVKKKDWTQWTGSHVPSWPLIGVQGGAGLLPGTAWRDGCIHVLCW